MVYLNAVTLRIAIKKGIPAYHCVDSRLYRIDKKHVHSNIKPMVLIINSSCLEKFLKNFRKDKKISFRRKEIYRGNNNWKKKYFLLFKTKENKSE